MQNPFENRDNVEVMANENSLIAYIPEQSQIFFWNVKTHFIRDNDFAIKQLIAENNIILALDDKDIYTSEMNTLARNDSESLWKTLPKIEQEVVKLYLNAGNIFALTNENVLYQFIDSKWTEVIAIKNLKSLFLINDVFFYIDNKAQLYSWVSTDKKSILLGRVTNSLNIPEQIVAGKNQWQDLYLQSTFVLAKTSDSQLYSWGGNLHNILARSINLSSPAFLPQQIPSDILPQFDLIATAEDYALGLTPNDKLYLWGNLSVIQKNQNTPFVFDLEQNNLKISQIDTIDDLVILLSDDGQLWIIGEIPENFPNPRQLPRRNNELVRFF